MGWDGVNRRHICVPIGLERRRRQIAPDRPAEQPTNIVEDLAAIDTLIAEEEAESKEALQQDNTEVVDNAPESEPIPDDTFEGFDSGESGGGGAEGGWE
jgi:hypothetical protein